MLLSAICIIVQEQIFYIGYWRKIPFFMSGIQSNILHAKKIKQLRSSVGEDISPSYLDLKQM